jgi:hypothetical protein
MRSPDQAAQRFGTQPDIRVEPTRPLIHVAAEDPARTFGSQ